MKRQAVSMACVCVVYGGVLARRGVRARVHMEYACYDSIHVLCNGRKGEGALTGLVAVYVQSPALDSNPILRKERT